MLRRTHWSTEQRPWYEPAEAAFYSDLPIFADLDGTSGDDSIKGTEGDDTIDGLAGNDMLKGQGGDDVIRGGDGNDVVFGGDGNDTLYGDGGFNEIRGGNGDDHIISGKVHNVIYGGTGNNIIDSVGSSSVYTIFGGIDQLGSARYWNVDYSLSTESIDISGYGYTFSNGTSAEQVRAYYYRLGYGDDSFSTSLISKRYSKVDAGSGSDFFEYIKDEDFFRMSLREADDGIFELSIYNSPGTILEAVYSSFERFHIVNHGIGQRIFIDGSLLYRGVHIDFELLESINQSGPFTIDFSTYDGEVIALQDGNTMNINGSTIISSLKYNITLNDEDGQVTASGTLTGAAGDDTLTGLAAFDTIIGGAGSDNIDGGAGDDYLDGGGGNDMILGSSGIDRIYGQGGLDTINGGDGIDAIDGGMGYDVIDGGDGDDTIDGGEGDDMVSGSAGADRLAGGLGDNIINGGDGNDILVSTADAIDVVDGGTGNDNWSGDDRASTQSLTAIWDGGLHVSDGIDVTNVESVSFVLGSGDDYLTISAAPVGMLTVNGNGGIDTIDYSAILGGGITLSLAVSGYQDTRAGGMEAIYNFENVIGSAKADTLTGNAVANVLTGGGGADTLTGGGGADDFIFTGLADLGRTANIDKIDRITDFSHTERDQIDLSAIDADPNADGDQAFDFVGERRFDVGGTGPGEIRFSQSIDGYLLVQGDIDHDGKADFSFLVRNTALVANDLVL